MYALACVLLVISGVVLMACTGVGPFSREPWESYYFSLRKKTPKLRLILLICASIIALTSTLILIGIIHD